MLVCISRIRKHGQNNRNPGKDRGALPSLLDHSTDELHAPAPDCGGSLNKRRSMRPNVKRATLPPVTALPPAVTIGAHPGDMSGIEHLFQDRPMNAPYQVLHTIRTKLNDRVGAVTRDSTRSAA